MNVLPKHGLVHRCPRRVVLAALVVVLILGGLLAHRLGSPSPAPSLAIPGIPTDGLDPDVSLAIAIAQKNVEENPQSAEAWGFLSKVLLANGRSSEAAVCLSHAEKLDEKNPRWPYYLALANASANVDEIIDCLRRAVDRGDRFEPAITAPRLQLATRLIQEGRNDEVGEMLRIVRAKEPENTQAIYLSALLMANRNDLRGSAALLRLLSENGSARQKACIKLAQIHLRLGDSKSAETWDKIARSLPEDLPWADPYNFELRQVTVGREGRFAEVNRLQAEGRYSEVVNMLNQMIQTTESAVDRAYVALGNNFVHLQRGPEAERAFEEALRLSPNDAETYNRLALIRMFQGEIRENRVGDREGAKAHYRRALESARNAVRINPDLAEAQMTLGQLLLYLGERQEGIAVLQVCLRSRPEMSRAHLLLGEVLAEDGRFVEARQHLLDAIRFADVNDQRAKQAMERFEKKHGKGTVSGTGTSAP